MKALGNKIANLLRAEAMVSGRPVSQVVREMAAIGAVYIVFMLSLQALGVIGGWQ